LLSSELEEMRNDFNTALLENIATDPEYSEHLSFNRFRHHDVVEGQVVNQRGEPMIDVIRKGLDSSRKASQSDPEMSFQAERDEGDVEVAGIVDDLEIGEMYAVVSMDPKESFKRDSKYWHDLGYREGLAVLQVYYKLSKNEVLAGAYSIKKSDENSLRQVMKGHGVEIPENESCNRWIRHGLRANVSEQVASNFGQNFQQEYKEQINDSNSVLSVNSFMEQHQKTIDQHFSVYMIALSRATYQRKNNETMSALAQAIMNNSPTLIHSDMHQLIQVNNSPNFSAENARFMEEKIRYALIEQLREYLPSALKQPDNLNKAEYVPQNNIPSPSGYGAMPTHDI